MATTSIEWTATLLPDGTLQRGYTFNPWIGCTHVHTGCKNCYAEADFDKRKHVAVWGPQGTRVVTGEENWRKPVVWNRQAAAAGIRRRVFCASLADVFEERPGQLQHFSGVPMWRMNQPNGHEYWWGAGHVLDNPGSGRPLTLNDVRDRLFALIRATPYLDWLIVTKRPENIRPMMVPYCLENVQGHVRQNEGDGKRIVPRRNVWLLTSISDQATADTMIPNLLKCRDLVPVLGLSCEPLLGPIKLDLLRLDVGNPAECVCGHGHGFTRCPNYGHIATNCHYKGCKCPGFRRLPGSWSGLDWVIAGGESGHGARPMHPDWARSLRDQCQAAAVPFFFKQWGEWLPALQDGADRQELNCSDSPIRVGKWAAGRLLDGREWNEFPRVEASA